VNGTRALLLLLTLASCARRGEEPGLGRLVAAGGARDLRPSADGAFVAWLDACVPLAGRAVPLGAARCDLRVAPAAAGEPVRAARGVTTLPGGFGWSAEGHVLAALEEHDAATGAGSLVAWTPGGEPRRLGEGVGFWGFAPRGRLLGFVWRGRVHLWRPGAEAEALPEPSGVATFEFHPAGEAGAPLLLARRAHAAGGDLWAVAPRGPPVRAGGPVGDYAFSPAGDRFAFAERRGDGHDLHLSAAARPGAKGRALGEGVTSFAFSRDGAALAFVAGVTPGRQGDLWLARGGGAPERIARGVGEFRFARASTALAWLEAYDPRIRSGRLAARAPGGRPRALGERVSSFEIAPDGSAVAWLAHVVAGGYSVDLWRASLAGGEPAQVARGVFGFDFGPGGALWYRATCRRSAEACDLLALPASGGEPRRIAEGVKSFELDARRPGRALLGWSRQDRVALDLAVWEGGKVVAVDRSALPGSAFLLAPDSGRVAYVVNDPKRAGVYVAELPR
jgi:hypothetical protein